LPTAIVYWPVTVGAQVHWLVPEFWRASNVQDQKLQRVVSTPGLLDAVAREHPDFWARFVPPAIGDDAITDISIHVLSTGKPRLLMTHLVEVDSAQHRYGVDSPEAHAAIEKDDAQIARLMRAVEALGLKEETAFVIASDHGFRAAPKAIRPCAVLAEAGLLTERAGKLTDWKATVQAHAGAAYVYVAGPTDEATQRRVRQLFEAKLAPPGSGISQLYEHETLVELGGDPAALFALGASPGYQFAPGCRGAYEVETGYAATHGYDPREPDMSASLLMVGPSLPHGKLVGARLIDLAPTIAGWLGLSMPSAEGVPLTIVPSP